MKSQDNLALRIIEGLIWSCIGALFVIILGADIKTYVKIICMIGLGLLVLGFILIIYYKFMGNSNGATGQEQRMSTDRRPVQAYDRNHASNSDYSNLRMNPQRSSMENAKINRGSSQVIDNQKNMIYHNPSQNMGRPETFMPRNPMGNMMGNPMEAKSFRQIVLLNEELQTLMKWDIAGKTALVIGKSTENESVDIDLSNSTYAQMISKQHAVLNYTPKGWCLEDIDSKNGTRVKRGNNMIDVASAGSVDLMAGDIMYIAMTMLQLQ